MINNADNKNIIEPPVNVSEIKEQMSEDDDIDIQKELEAKFDELFGPVE